mmetsp:Transcript_19228/g.31109  ORF Transcript_19228/g.31109 Transcript_19228/m.31109 type:complete len:301 (-) Transcript_19228:12-914(-)
MLRREAEVLNSTHAQATFLSYSGWKALLEFGSRGEGTWVLCGFRVGVFGDFGFLGCRSVLLAADAAEERTEQRHQSQAGELQPLVCGGAERELPSAAAVEVGARGELRVLTQRDAAHCIPSESHVTPPVHEAHSHGRRVRIAGIVRVAKNRLAVPAICHVLVRANRTRAHNKLGTRGHFPAVLELGAQRQGATHQTGAEARGDLIHRAELPACLGACRVCQLLAHRLHVHSSSCDQLLAVRNRHFTLEAHVGIFLIFGELTAHVAGHRVADDERLVHAEALDATLMVPPMRLHDGAHLPL